MYGDDTKSSIVHAVSDRLADMIKKYSYNRMGDYMNIFLKEGDSGPKVELLQSILKKLIQKL